MAREEADRENLLADATAYVERIEWQIDMPQRPACIVFAGFRKDGRASFYFGADPVYHYNAAGELRRAFSQGRIIKAERGALVSLVRVRSADEVVLSRTELSAAEAAEFCLQARDELQYLLACLSLRHGLMRGQHPVDGEVEARVIHWLESLTDISIAQSPRAGD